MASISPPQLTFREILVASDFSEASGNAIAYAKAFAKRFQSHITLVHVSEPVYAVSIPEGEWIDYDSPTRIEQEVEAAGIALRAEGFSAEAVDTLGSVKHEILALAEARHGDLIIIGTHGRRGLNRLLFGSKAESIIRQSDFPILTVGPAARQATGEAWAPKKILCTTSLNPKEARSVAFGYMLAQSAGATFSVLSTEDSHRGPDERGLQAFEAALAEAARGGCGTIKDRILTRQFGTNPAVEIIDAARKLKTDLIVMGARASRFGVIHLHASVLSHVLVEAPCPVLTIHTES